MQSTHIQQLKSFLPLLFLLVFASCSEKESLSFTPLNVASHPCDSCPSVQIALPEAEGPSKVARAINTALREEVIELLTFDETQQAGSIDEAIASFQRGYDELRELYQDETPGWKAELAAEITYEDEEWVSIRLDSYSFTGGAHGYGSVRYLNFNKQKGSEVATWELFSKQEDFERFAELKFREQENIPADQSINSTGFMFEDDRFYLPENIGFCKEGIKLHYNQYEVASYADGPIELTIPFTEVKAFLN